MVKRPWTGSWKDCLESGATPPSGCRQRGADCQEQIFRRSALAGRANEICQGTAVPQAFGDAPKESHKRHDTLEGEKKKTMRKKTDKKGYLARLRRRSANEHHALPSNLRVGSANIWYMNSRWQIWAFFSSLEQICCLISSLYIFLSTSQCLRLNMLRRASKRM